MFKKILIANRGEIALRVIRACKELGITAATIYSEADRESLHVLRADEAYLVGPPSAIESYLNIPRIIEIAKKYDCEAIHPGYGFLAENSEFAKRCEEAGIVFIGPNPTAMQKMGDKVYARNTARRIGVPTIPGAYEGFRDYDSFYKEAKSIGYPLLIKAAMGGGGKGMRIVREEKELESSFNLCREEALGAFGDPTLYIERYIEKPRHIEFQILADNYGNAIHLFERECSIQRRHQKLLEETPSVALNEELRKRMGQDAVKIVKAVGYNNAGTVEFLLDQNRNYYFLEMNTRLQVEHPVTELTTGIDLVKEQIHIASGEKLRFKQEDIKKSGHAIEVRIYAEDPENNFLPSCGKIEFLSEPSGPGVRVDSGIYQGYEIPVYYDPLIAKLIVYASTRKEAISRLKRALFEYEIGGVKTTIGFFLAAIEDKGFQKGDYHTGFIEMGIKREVMKDEELASIAAALLTHSGKIQKTVAQKQTQSPWKYQGRIDEEVIKM